MNITETIKREMTEIEHRTDISDDEKVSRIAGRMSRKNVVCTRFYRSDPEAAQRGGGADHADAGPRREIPGTGFRALDQYPGRVSPVHPGRIGKIREDHR